MQAFWDWLVGEAGAAWILGLLATAGAIYSWLRRERPARVVIHEIASIKLLDVPPTLRDKLDIMYDSDGQLKHIDSMETRIFVMYNTGTRDLLEPVRITLHYGGTPQFVECASDTPGCKLVPNLSESSIGVEAPYLNSYPVHEDYVKFLLHSDDHLELDLLHGTGKGWSATFLSRAREKTLRRRFEMLTMLLSYLLTVALFSVMVLVFLRPSTREGPICVLSTFLASGLLVALMLFILEKPMWRKLLGGYSSSEFGS